MGKPPCVREVAASRGWRRALPRCVVTTGFDDVYSEIVFTDGGRRIEITSSFISALVAEFDSVFTCVVYAPTRNPEQLRETALLLNSAVIGFFSV